MKRFIFSTLVIMLLNSCATSAKAPSFAVAPIPEPTADISVLYIYRHYAQPTAWSAYLKIDKQEVVSLNQEGFTWIYVTPGKRKFKFGWPGLAAMPSVEFEHTLEPGNIYAFEMQGSATMTRTVSAIQPTDIDAAKQKMLACCRYVAPKKTTF